MASDQVGIVLRFIEAINQHDLDRILTLMTEDHLFVDSVGNSVQGRENLRKAWQQYLRMFPDYQIVVGEIFQQGNEVAVFGEARGTYAVGGELLPENRWAIPASWRAKVCRGAIARWQVYADNGPVREILARHGGA